MNSSKSGKWFEHLLYNLLSKHMKLASKSNTMKLAHFQGLKLQKSTQKIQKIQSQLLKYMEKFFKNIAFFEVVDDHLGRVGISSDVYLYLECGEKVGISLKRNNVSIKSQRPGGIGKQMNFTKEEKKLYKKEYHNLCLDIRQKHLIDKISYNELNFKNKNDMLFKVNSLYFTWIKSSSEENKRFFIKFLLGDADYIIKLDKLDNVNMYKTRIDQTSIISHLYVKNHLLFIKLNDGINLKLRLHTASLKISKTLSFKYDTTICNFDSFAKECQK